jgi:predicted CoA-binding protein
VKKKTLVLGASDNPSRYSYLAILKLLEFGHPVVAIGNKLTVVAGVAVSKNPLPIDSLHTVTLYLNPTNQQPYYDYILSLQPQRIIFNPGTENYILFRMAKERGIEVINACTLVMLATHQF